MESEARYAWVGAVMVLLAVLLVYALIWLQGRDEGIATKRYTLYFSTQSLDGLQIDSDVKMLGVKIGRVVDYAILPGHSRRVRVIAQVDQRAPVLEGVLAVIDRNLVTGLASISLLNHPEATAALTQVPEGERYPVIPEGTPRIERFAGAAENIAEQGRVALTRINTLLSDDNQRNLSRSLAHIETLTSSIAANAPRITTTLDELDSAATRITGASIDTFHAMQITADTVTAMALRAEDALEGLNLAARQTQLLTLRLDKSADLMEQQALSAGQRLGIAAEALVETSQAYKEPSRILYGPMAADFGPGENK
jgi:phospholipid/cholesterol/gamma-HCH transport system substrate-binding protein